MITDILDLERGKNYLVEYREPGSRTINFIGKFRPGRYWPPTDYLPDNLSFEIMYYYEFVYDIDGSFGTKWKPWNWRVDEELYPQDLNSILINPKRGLLSRLTPENFSKKYVKIYSLGQSGQLITPTTPPNQVPEIAHLISGNDPKTKFSKLPKEATDNIKSFLGGKRKSRRKSRRSRRSRKTRKYKRK